MTSNATHQRPTRSQDKWSAAEDALIIRLRGRNMKWEDISKRMPGRSAIACRLHYQNFLERRSEWDEERMNKLARLYERFKPEIWAKVAEEMAVPWRAVEAMHWQLGEKDMARRAGVIPFSLSAANAKGNNRSLPSRSHVHLQPSGTMSRDSGVPSRQTLHNRPLMPASTRIISSRQEPVPPPPRLPMGLDSARVQYAPGPGLAPIQKQPLSRPPGMLPGVDGLIHGISPYSAPATVPNTGPITEVAQSTLGATLASYSLELAGSKRRASPDGFSYNAPKVRRISQGLLSS
ncbi:hypothetical protein AU210_015742 [Fusarium oxysporum f. sp. radicis-cucumerinum]|uniref:DRPLA protein n=1 Tax=Fusarium oxysporum f. sp. radicis-cucumerinum TaxID=327505 RepID=A0A2H3GA24_FUSOX|nr:hypothetical protein AU210_015742 [Fusarium oxysporum f. sp. radicis-cucumerinum]